MSIIRILQVCPKDYESIGGGVEHTVRKLCEGLKSREHEVSVVCGGSPSKTAEMVEVGGIQVVKVPTYAPSNSFHIPKNRKIVKEAIGNDFDIVHTHSAHSVISMLPLELKKSPKTRWKLVYSMHFSTSGYTFFRSFIWRVFWKRRLNSRLKYVDAVHSTSLLESGLVRSQFSNAEGKISLVPLGLDDDVFSNHWKGMNSDYILYCGRVEKYKRIDLAVKAIEQARGGKIPIKFLIVGDGSMLGYYKKIAKEKDWIVCLPHKKREEYLELLSNARAVISLSSAENFNLFLAEAGAIGVPIIATPQALAFYPQCANVNSLKISDIAEVITGSIYASKPYVLPAECILPTWKEATGHFEELYEEVLGQTKPAC